ncbi:MAG: hypothetical protein K6A41_07065 [Bacteroidales bacterium]|nr:hypothetical protein [Bacteroidales bacterium]
MSQKRNNFRLFLDRAMSRSLGRQILIMLALFVVLLLISFILLSFSGSDWRAYCLDKNIPVWSLPIFLLIDSSAYSCIYLAEGTHGWLLIASGISYLFGLIIFNGIIIGIITNTINRRVEAHRNGLLQYLKSGHFIIMGYDDMVPSIISELFAKDPKADVLLLTALDAKVVNEKLLRSVAHGKMDQIFITYGHRTMKDCYKSIHLEAAKEIFVVGNRTRPEHDAANVESVDSIYAYLTETASETKPRRITCVFEDFDTYSSFKTTEIFSQICRLGIEFVPYNFYDDWANQVLVRRSYKEKNSPKEAIPYPSVYGDGIVYEDTKRVHLVFFGLSNFSTSLAVEAAHLLHFPNFDRDNSLRTRITFIDKHADEQLLVFTTRNRHFFEVQPYFFSDMSGENAEYLPKKIDKLVSKDLPNNDFLDVEFEFVKGDAFDSNIQNMIKEWAEDTDNQYLSVFIAMSDQRQNFILGMNMPDEVYDNAVPLFIRQNRADDFVTNLRKADDKEYDYAKVDEGKLHVAKRGHRYANIYPFGMDDMAYSLDETIIDQAKLLNYLYETADYNTFRYKSPKELEGIPEKDLWSAANKYWLNLPVAKKWSNLYCVSSIVCKLDTLQAMRDSDANGTSILQNPFTDKEIEILGRVEHNRWNVEKLLMGFRKPKSSEDLYCNSQFEKELSANKKLYVHHAIRPFNDLSPDLQQFDFEIVKYIPWLMRMTLK